MNNPIGRPSIEQFYKALTDLIAISSELPPIIDHPVFQQKVGEVCRSLGIARCEARIIYNRHLSGIQDDIAILYGEENYNDKGALNIRRDLPDGNSACYTIYPMISASEWTADEMTAIRQFISSMYVINGRMRMLGLIEKLAFHDQDTGAYTLTYMLKSLNERIEKGVIGEYSVCRLNLRNFTAVNAKIGRKNGTIVLKRYIEMLTKLIGEDGIVARLGGDNFIAFFHSEKFDDIVKFLNGTDIPTDFRGLPTVGISAYAGLLDIADNDITVPDVMDRINAAFEIAKNKKKNKCVVFNEKFKEKRDNIKKIESLFYDAIDNREFLVYYQSKIDLESKTLIGAEALCRWQHDGRLVPPGEFIGILEMSNNICILDYYMLDAVCRDIRRWLDSGIPVVKVSVNMSRIHLGDRDFANTIKSIIDSHNVPHKYIEIELTETTTDVDFDELKEAVELLHEYDISTSVDDFGEGYSSLKLIRDLPWNVLKIDKSFLPEGTDKNSETKMIMLKYVIAMAHQLGLECIVEGVETHEQVELLKSYSCFRAQGFLFDRPLAVSDFEDRLEGKHKY